MVNNNVPHCSIILNHKCWSTEPKQSKHMSQFQYFWSSLYNVMSCVLYEFTVLQKYEGNICISEHLMMDKNEIILYFDVNSLGFLPFLSIHDSSLQIAINNVQVVWSHSINHFVVVWYLFNYILQSALCQPTALCFKIAVYECLI